MPPDFDTSPLTTNSTVSTWDESQDDQFHKMQQGLRHVRYDEESKSREVSGEELNERVGRLGLMRKFGSAVNVLSGGGNIGDTAAGSGDGNSSSSPVNKDAGNHNVVVIPQKRNRRIGSIRLNNVPSSLASVPQGSSQLGTVETVSPTEHTSQQEGLSAPNPAAQFSEHYNDDETSFSEFAEEWDQQEEQPPSARPHFSVASFSPMDGELSATIPGRDGRLSARRDFSDLKTARGGNKHPPRLELQSLSSHPNIQHSQNNILSARRPPPQNFHALNSGIEEYVVRYVSARYHTQNEPPQQPEQDDLSRISSMHGSTMSELLLGNSPKSNPPPLPIDTPQDLDNVSLSLSPRAHHDSPLEEQIDHLKFNSKYPSLTQTSPSNFQKNLAFYHTLREQVHATAHGTKEPSKEDLILYTHHLMSQVQFLTERLRNQEEICSQFEQNSGKKKKKGKKSSKNQGRPSSRSSSRTPGSSRPGSASSRFTISGLVAAATIPEKFRAERLKRSQEMMQKRRSAILRANQLQRFSARFLRKKAGKSHVDVHKYVQQKVEALCIGWIVRRRSHKRESAVIVIQYHWRCYLRRKIRGNRMSRFSDDNF